MEAASEQEDDVFIRNPTSCTAPIMKHEMPSSPFLSSLGFVSHIVLYLIRRPEPDAIAQSPWSIKNLCTRLDMTVPVFFNQALMEEAKVVRKFNSPHIAGAIASEGLELCKRQLAMDYCSKTLAELLSVRFDARLGPVEAEKAYKVVLAALGGLDYLHTKQRIMHGDLKSYNILVDDEFANIKLCGLGTKSKALTESGTLEGGASSIGVGIWSAPEVLGNTDSITAKADIFAFGLVVYELLACYPPHTFPGILDYMLAPPKDLMDMRNDTAKEEEDEEDLGSTEFPCQKPMVVARKRKMPMTAAAPMMTKRIKFPEVINLIEDEEENCISVDAKDQAVDDEKVSETKQQADSNGPKSDAVTEENATDVKKTETGKTENITEPVAKGNDTEQQNDVGKVPDTVLPVAENIGEKQTEVSEATIETVDSSTDRSPASKVADTAAEATVMKAPDVVTVIDSSDEDSATSTPSFLNSSVDYYSGDVFDFSPGSPAYFEESDNYEIPDDEVVSDEGSDIEGNFLNYRCLGTRPPLPCVPVLGKEYDKLLETFYVCTAKNNALRPTAAQLLQAYQDHHQAQS